MDDFRIIVARTTQEYEACQEIRRRVFVEEQGIFSESDTDEHDATAIHILALKDNVPVGTVRCYRHHGNVWYGGRLAVLRNCRLHLGAQLVRRAVEIMSAHKDVSRFFALVQIQNVRFFQRLKWTPLGVPFLYGGKEHQLMERHLDRAVPLHDANPANAA